MLPVQFLVYRRKRFAEHRIPTAIGYSFLLLSEQLAAYTIIKDVQELGGDGAGAKKPKDWSVTAAGAVRNNRIKIDFSETNTYTHVRQTETSPNGTNIDESGRK